MMYVVIILYSIASRKIKCSFKPSLSRIDEINEKIMGIIIFSSTSTEWLFSTASESNWNLASAVFLLEGEIPLSKDRN